MHPTVLGGFTLLFNHKSPYDKLVDFYNNYLKNYTYFDF